MEHRKQNINIEQRSKVYDSIEKVIKANKAKVKITTKEKDNFINCKTNILGHCELSIAFKDSDDIDKIARQMNKLIQPYGGYIEKNKYNILTISCYDNGFITESYSSKKSNNDIFNIINQLSKKEYDYIGGGYWVDSDHVIYRKIEYKNNKPVAFIDIYLLPKFPKTGLVVLAVLKEYRLNGLASKLVKEAIINIKNDKRINKLRWATDSDNTGSAALAKSLGFVLINNTKKEKIFIYDLNDDNFALPNEEINSINLQSLLDNADTNKIYLTSDWHLFKNHYKHEKNYVNTKEIVSWCKKNIKDTDIFIYLGDISFRFANKKDQEESAKIMNSLPGIKILVLGNHDTMLGQDYFNSCGFKYVVERINYKKFIFTHRPINMDLYPDDYLNIHGHIHKWTAYNTTDGKKNINVYPYFYNNHPVTLDYIVNNVDKLTKNNYYNDNDILGESLMDIENFDNMCIYETKRSELPDSAFGIPKERKFPLDTEQHVKSAIKLFGHASEDNKKALAKNIADAAKRYNLTIPDNTQCYKYLNENFLKDNIPDDVTTIIFDIGKVLVYTDTLETLHKNLLLKHIFVHEIYDDIVQKDLLNNPKLKHCTVEEAEEYLESILSDFLKPFADDIINALKDALHEYEYVDKLITALRAKKYKIYFLSNWDRWLYELQKEVLDNVISKLDGGIFSFQTDYEKPDLEFFNILLKKYNLDPNKCFFFDDTAENLIAAEYFGIRGMLYNTNETPSLILQDLLDEDPKEIEIHNKALINTGIKLEAVSLEKLKYWYVSSDDNLSCIDKDMWCPRIEFAIDRHLDLEKPKDKVSIVYIYTCNDRDDIFNPSPVGKLEIYLDDNHEWKLQSLLNYSDNDQNISPFTESNSLIDEWSAASCNPIISTIKPAEKAYILKIVPDCGNKLVNPKQYILSPDIISDKYLVINEEAHLEIIDHICLDGCTIEAYEYIGSSKYLNKINEAYKSNKIVDNTFFYTSLTGKPMLCEDQIDYDSNFRKVDFEQLTENYITEMATIRDKYLELTGNKNNYISVIESFEYSNIPFINKYKDFNDIVLREDIDGYYFYSKFTKKRSKSVPLTTMLTEAMIKSVINK